MNRIKKNNSSKNRAAVPKAKYLNWMIKALSSQKSSSRLRQAIIRRLGTMRNTRAVYFLNRVLLNPDESGVRRGLAAVALFEIATMKGGPNIEKMLRAAWGIAEEERNYKLADNIHGLLVKLRKIKEPGLQTGHISDLEFALIMARFAEKH